MIRAFVCQEEEEWNSVVVFAESAGKARYIAMCSYELGEDLQFQDVRVYRAPSLDKCYRGLNMMNWNDPQDRIAMVRDAGFQCSGDWYDPVSCDCCAAREYCDTYKDRIEEEAK